ncbi:MAG: bifunctional DNA-formamidopyrimidine glycosylase/DNA-(apurinic or apyrimidinic site) lyase [Sinobacteraceae bacterium]|nr:bifunctional DNA-formamidopyrimidine glycosylase/DNA-(apurinic or apyrimidinic site) lyase [Nevskiaceae bacterium]MBV9316570.1 bifunctional DNA-formamidopyrimidine glycosylase/DNA-(apurinic or apyrimidinic site) lyase [Gammaproteobacteria bacterium]
MPELPEVETTRRGLAPHVRRRRVARLSVYERRLRWPVPCDLPRKVAGQRIVRLGRRAKYLLLGLESGTLLLHLGMSGNLRAVPAATPRLAHDHFDLVLDSGIALRFNDPRRFGSLLYTSGEPQRHPLLAHLAPEPFSKAFDADYLYRITRGRKVAIKHLLMNSRLVVGVGNIYASEALFRARLRPQRRAATLSRAECARLVRAVRTVLRLAIRAGGTTLRDYLGADGLPGYFRQRLYVYERAQRPCRRCGTSVRGLTQGQRSTYYCPQCQR